MRVTQFADCCDCGQEESTPQHFGGLGVQKNQKENTKERYSRMVSIRGGGGI